MRIVRTFLAAICISAASVPVFAQLSEGSNSGDSAGGAVFAPSTDQIQNSGLGVRILFVGRNADGKTLTISAEVQNLLDQPGYIALVGPAPAAIDTQGVTYELKKVAGVALCKNLSNDGIKGCFSNAYGNYLPGSSFSVLQPKASSIVAMTFGAADVSDAGFLSATMNVALAVGERPSDSQRKTDEAKLENVSISFPLVSLENVK